MKLREYPALSAFLHEHAAATIAVPIDEAGTLHAASLLYWHSDGPLEFYFVTSRNSEKSKQLNLGAAVPCAVVVGTEKGTPFSLQMRGTIREVDPTQYATQLQAYYEKRGDRRDDIDEPDTCFLKFVPSWARFTNYAKGYDRNMLDVSS